MGHNAGEGERGKMASNKDNGAARQGSSGGKEQKQCVGEGDV